MGESSTETCESHIGVPSCADFPNGPYFMEKRQAAPTAWTSAPIETEAAGVEVEHD